jgi:hypothetical protein
MALSYDVVRGHIAGFLHVLSTAPSFWFTLNTTYDHHCHLSNRFGLSSHEYETLLTAADLACHSESGFTIKRREWRAFLDGYHFTSTQSSSSSCKIEFDEKRMDIDAFINGVSWVQEKRDRVYIIRLGVKRDAKQNKFELQSDHLGRMITTPPPLDDLDHKQQNFREAIKLVIEPTMCDSPLQHHQQPHLSKAS